MSEFRGLVPCLSYAKDGGEEDSCFDVHARGNDEASYRGVGLTRLGDWDIGGELGTLERPSQRRGRTFLSAMHEM